MGAQVADNGMNLFLVEPASRAWFVVAEIYFEQIVKFFAVAP